MQYKQQSLDSNRIIEKFKSPKSKERVVEAQQPISLPMKLTILEDRCNAKSNSKETNVKEQEPVHVNGKMSSADINPKKVDSLISDSKEKDLKMLEDADAGEWEVARGKKKKSVIKGKQDQNISIESTGFNGSSFHCPNRPSSENFGGQRTAHRKVSYPQSTNTTHTKKAISDRKDKSNTGKLIKSSIASSPHPSTSNAVLNTSSVITNSNLKNKRVIPDKSNSNELNNRQSDLSLNGHSKSKIQSNSHQANRKECSSLMKQTSDSNGNILFDNLDKNPVIKSNKINSSNSSAICSRDSSISSEQFESHPEKIPAIKDSERTFASTVHPKHTEEASNILSNKNEIGLINAKQPSDTGGTMKIDHKPILSASELLDGAVKSAMPTDEPQKLGFTETINYVKKSISSSVESKNSNQDAQEQIRGIIQLTAIRSVN